MTIYSPALSKEKEPLYMGLADAIERDISAGVLAPGTRLPTHRDLADSLGLNVSTVTRGYREAEKRGLVSGTVGRGTFVASDATTSTSLVSFEPCPAGMLEMGLIEPLDHLDPSVTEGFKRISRRKDPSTFMRYSDPRGQLEHRRAGAEWANRFGMEAEAENIIVSAGSQHALTCALSGLLRPGERIATDELTYPGLKTLVAMLGLRLVPIRMDEHGMVPASLDAACRRDEIKAVYLMPGVHNPTTITIPEARRDELARLADKHDLIIIEDDAYDLTDPGRLEPVGNRARHRSIYIAGMSKSLAAGLRVAFVVAPASMLKPLAQAVLNTIWMAPPLNVELTSMWINDGTADRVVEQKRAEAARRYMLACDLLDGFRFRGKPSGFYLWCELPEPWTGQALENAAREHGVNVFGAEKFVVGDSPPPRAARISLTGTSTVDQLEKGLRIIRDIVEDRP
ncbi:PLP-dependent aminotransferase family protein [Pseudodesulfovibrio sp. S3]|uniref:aminotransferase-like domain-containing protein n=2 Tax=unclassified Pseudodesulfovibrio TaxID=2661612 RepID=UPI000FEB8658|nr:PLP-dependent aminotransferase family protein [Pseudodesulfovibrio sp. S3]MCJ2165295.1 PLP-dependent aminotransferase family protein [Pseudodesulfovibrio sp. S3-i]RWU03355.1 PLP-dependent aminotransferase family protein [Pseudodesulfovibrio sp. S3]